MSHILAVKEVTKFLGGEKILSNISFKVQSWEIYGFLWPNWAWKTTTMKAVMGLISPESGTINVFWTQGLDIEDKKKIGFMPENTYLYKHLTGREFLKFNGAFFGLSGKKLEEKVNSLLHKVWIEQAGDNYLHSYSKWMLQRVWLAQALINDPELLFLDEPMSWLDPIGRKRVKDILVELNQQWTTIFFNTHILADVESICDRIAIIDHGKIIVEGKKITDISWSLEDYFIEQVSK